MIQSSNKDVANTLRDFNKHGIDCGFLVPTKTGLEKSIMDATEDLRQILKNAGLHDFDEQGQGGEHKVTVPTVLFSSDNIVETQTSLYRPETKSGDPRIWVSKLKEYAVPTDLLAFVATLDKLIVINCSKTNLSKILGEKTSAFWNVFKKKSAELPDEVVDLRDRIAEIYRRGYIRTLRAGDTGVGFTLESLLGISANSSKSPDYRGIEIKTGRKSSHVSGRTTIMSQVPDWSVSRLKGSLAILKERGRYNELKGRCQLFHEMTAIKPNSYGLVLRVDHGRDLLHQNFELDGVSITDVSWQFSKLFDRLQEKHKQTFWIKAETRGKGESEEFWFNTINYTSGVNSTKLPLLIEAGIVSVDYTKKETKTGGAKDQGYLFKIRQADLPLLFVAPLQLVLF
jgi:hypothetical protein